ncbi:MAG: ABC-type multidrug transport system fused ATPase/permease subunit [Thalassolituus oleivorans]|jgi:ABC-type multidrug transport system fused ATPase/permease subunit
MAALERVAALLEADPETQGETLQIPDGDVSFDDVTFSYPGAPEPVLSDLSFTVAPGKTVALVGPSGAGKSTITKLLTRFYDPDSGTIRMGGRDVRSYDLEALRRAISVVPQEPTLFSGSVTDNIRYARPDATDQEIEQAAAIANADGFVSQLPEGYNTEIGERGTKLSGGQKQRIAIARAILKNARVLILDEATASLDSESESVIQDALEGSFAQQNQLSTIVIAHRLSTIQNADNILVLDAGKLVESGTHIDLLQEAGLYARLHELQFRTDSVV